MEDLYSFNYFIKEASLFNDLIKSNIPNINKEAAFRGLVECRHRCSSSSDFEKERMFSILLISSYELEKQLIKSVFKEPNL